MSRAAVIAVAAVVALAACGGDDDASDTASTSPDASLATGDEAELSLVTIEPPTTVATPEVELPETAPTELGQTVITEGSGIEASEGDGVLVRYVGVSFDTGEQFDSNFGGGEPLPVVLGEGRVIAGWDQGLIGVQAGERLQLDIPADLAYGPAPTDTTTADTTDTTTGGTTTAGSTATTTAAAPAGPPTGPLSFVIDVLAVVPPTDPTKAPTAEEIPTLCPRPVTETTTADTTGTTVPPDTADTAAATSVTADAAATTAAGWRTSPAASDDTTASTSATTTAEATDGTTGGSAGSDTTEPTNGTCDVHVDEVVTDDLTVGDGPTARLGQIAIMHFTLARADNGVVLRSSWDDGSPTQLVLQPGAEMSGMITGIEGMQVGGRRAITVPYLEAFGERGFPTAGLPAETDVVVIVDLLGVYN